MLEKRVSSAEIDCAKKNNHFFDKLCSNVKGEVMITTTRDILETIRLEFGEVMSHLELRIISLEEKSPIPAGAGLSPTSPEVLELNVRIHALERDMLLSHLPRIAALEQTNDTFTSATKANFSRIKIFSTSITEGLAYINERIAAHDQEFDDLKLFRPYPSIDERFSDIKRRMLIFEGDMRFYATIDVRLSAAELRQFYSIREDSALRDRISSIEDCIKDSRSHNELELFIPTRVYNVSQF
jgi:hypothetical protein